MEFEKINISEKDFKNILERVINTYWDVRGSVSGSIEIALKEHLFNVQKDFKEDDWNDCTVTPPEEYQDIDLLIRPKNIPLYGDECLTTRHTAYKVGYCNNATGKFMCKGENVFDSESKLQEYEYKVVK